MHFVKSHRHSANADQMRHGNLCSILVFILLSYEDNFEMYFILLFLALEEPRVRALR